MISRLLIGVSALALTASGAMAQSFDPGVPPPNAGSIIGSPNTTGVTADILQTGNANAASTLR